VASPKAQARSASKSRKKKDTTSFRLPFTRRNYLGLGLGILVIIIGFICLSRPPVEGFVSVTLAPVLLVLGYCVIIPISIFLKEPKAKTSRE
jgi:uncharacterized membrane protein HdeD (DUF308 family)